jgi:hypothetical protein
VRAHAAFGGQAGVRAAQSFVRLCDLRCRCRRRGRLLLNPDRPEWVPFGPHSGPCGSGRYCRGMGIFASGQSARPSVTDAATDIARLTDRIAEMAPIRCRTSRTSRAVPGAARATAPARRIIVGRPQVEPGPVRDVRR